MESMATKKQNGTEVFMRMWAAWETVVPLELVRQNPKLVIGTLELSGRPEGIFQMELKRKLGVNQPRLSKMTSKLRKAGLVKVSIPAGDRRKALVRTSEVGKALLADFNSKLGGLGVARSSSPHPRRLGKSIRDAAGQTTFFREIPSGDSN
jgi:DNA-binding MarR family transcriptional regulator